jgi:hypothetical protein
LTKEELATRNDLVAALPERIQSIPDGTAQPKQSGSWFGSGSRPTNEIKFDSGSYTFRVDSLNYFCWFYSFVILKWDW